MQRIKMIIINTLIPIFFLIALGYFFKHIKFPHEDFWKYLDTFNYYILFPALLIYKLSTAQTQDINSFNFILSAIISLIILSILLILYNKFFSFENHSFTSIYQGSVRFNTYVFLALVSSLLGDEGLVLALILITFLIPMINVFCISIFSIYLPTTKITLLSFIKSILKNPLILSCIFGGSLNFFSIRLPFLVENTLSIISTAALPLGLLSVGVGLHLSSILTTKSALFLSSSAKLLVLPIIMFAFGKLFNLQSNELSVLVLYACMPTASSGYILARQLGGDLKLISSIVSIQTILSIFSISIMFELLHNI